MENKLFHLLKGLSERIKDELLLFSFAVILLLTFIPVEGVRYVILTVYVIGAMLHTSFRYKRTPKIKAVEPKMYINISKQRGESLLEIVNTGGEDIIDFKVLIGWYQSIGAQKRELSRFLLESDDLYKNSAKDLNVIKKGERIYASEIPRYSEDGKILVTATGTGAESGKQLEHNVEVKNEIKQGI